MPPFNTMTIRGNPVFKDQTIEFSPSMNIITGPNASGKTALFNLIKVGTTIGNKPGLFSAPVGLVFVPAEIQLEPLDKAIKDFIIHICPSKELESEVEPVFKRYINKPYIMKTGSKGISFRFGTSDLDIGSLPAGDKVFIFYALLLAARKMGHVEDPLVMDSPFSLLDLGYRKALMHMLSGLDQQVIILTNKIQGIRAPNGAKRFKITEGVVRPVK